MIKFEKVSFAEFYWSVKDVFGYVLPDGEIQKIYDGIKLPQRSTAGSAGYDFFAPFDFSIFPHFYQLIPTGIRFKTSRNDVVLAIFPRSGLGFKYQSRLANSTALIDSDYQYSDNEGHIFVKMTGDEPFSVDEGKAFCQGVILPFLKTDDDDSTDQRNGGFGSTGA